MAGSVRPRAKWSRAHSGASAADAIALEGSSSPPPTASTSGPSEPRSQASRYRPSVERAARAGSIDRGQSDENEYDDDDFFMRRRTVQRPIAAPHHQSRSSASVYKPGEASKSAYLQRSRVADYPDYPSKDDEEEAPSSSQTSADRRRQKKRRRERAPSWTRQIPSARSDGLIDSDPDANREHSGSADDDGLSPSAGPSANKRKKKPRSPSLTPPPEMPAEYRLKISQMVDEVMASHRTERSPTSSPEPDHLHDPRRPTGRPRASRTTTRDSASATPVDYSSSRQRSDTRESSADHGDDGSNGQSGDANGNRAQSLSAIHPDLAPFLRGSQAAELRKQAKLEEAKRKQKEEERAASRAREREQAEREAKQKEANRRQTLARLSETAVSAEGRSNRRNAQDAISLSSSDSAASARPWARSGKPTGSTANANGEAVISISDSEDDNGDAAAWHDAPSAPSAVDARYGEGPAAAPSPAPLVAPEEEVERITLTLRDSRGKEMDQRVRSTTVLRKMLDHFLLTMYPTGGNPSLSAVERRKARLKWEGETLDLDKPLSSVDGIEEEDTIEVHY